MPDANDRLAHWIDDKDRFRQEIEKFRLETVILFADMANSTQYKQTHDLFSGFIKTFQHNATVIKVAAEHDGRRIKEIGDEVMCRFKPDNVLGAVRAAVGVLRNFKSRNGATTDDDKHLSRIAIHFATRAVPYPLTAESPRASGEDGSLDVIGPCIDLAARVTSQVRPEQALLTEETFAHLSSADKANLTTEGIQFSDPAELNGLKGLDNCTVSVREIIWDGKEKGIGLAPAVQALIGISVKAGEAFHVLDALNRDLAPSVLVGGGVTYGARGVFLRIQARDMAEYRDLVVETVQKTHGILMTYSSFLFPGYIYVGSPNNGGLRFTALVMIHTTEQFRASYSILEYLRSLVNDKTLIESKLQFRLLEAAVTFGEQEVYALISTSSATALSRLIMEYIHRERRWVSGTTTNVVMNDPFGTKTSSFFWRPALVI